MERLAGKFILLWGWRRALAAFLAGAIAVLSLAPFDFFAVGFVSFPILVWLLDGATVERPARLLRRLRPAFAIGWWFGFGYFVCGLWWVGGAVLVDADEFAWALPIAIVLLPALLAVFYGLAAAVARLVWTDDIGRIASLAATFAFFEWVRTFIFTGFPWNPIGHAVNAGAAADAVRLGRRNVRNECLCGAGVFTAGLACRLSPHPHRHGACGAACRSACRVRLRQAA